MNNRNGVIVLLVAACCIILPSCSDDATDPVNKPVAAFTVSSATLSEGDTLRVTNTSTYATTYAWSISPGGQTSTEKDPSFEMTSEGTYTVQLIATGSGGSDTATQTVTVSINKVWRAIGHGKKTWYIHTLTVAGSDLSVDPCYWDNTITFDMGSFSYVEGDDVCADSPIPEQSGTFEYAEDLSTVTMNITSPFVSSILYTVSGLTAESVTVSTTFSGGAPVQMYLTTEKRTE